MRVIPALLALSVALTVAQASARPRRRVTVPPPDDVLAGGAHWRFTTDQGPLHVWQPARFDRRRADVVVYVHGLYIHADEAMQEHTLAAQFAASRRNALFIVPEAPATAEEDPSWLNLNALLRTTARHLRRPLPRGALVVVGHSGAFRTIANWLGQRPISEVILLDALYGNEDDFEAWFKHKRGRLTLVARGTTKWTEPFIKRFRHYVERADLPERAEDFTRRERRARLLYVHSQYGHFELVTEGKALPVLLRRREVGRSHKPRVSRPRRHDRASPAAKQPVGEVRKQETLPKSSSSRSASLTR